MIIVKILKEKCLFFVVVFLIFFFAFLQSNTPLIAQEKVCPNRHTVSSFLVTYSFRYVMTI